MDTLKPKKGDKIKIHSHIGPLDGIMLRTFGFSGLAECQDRIVVLAWIPKEGWTLKHTVLDLLQIDINM